MAKRTATRELTDRNWDEEDEPEEAGEFIQATEDVLKTRQIKKAKRRGMDAGSEGGASVFTGFAGFKSNASTASFGGALFTDKNKNGSNSGKTDSVKSENGGSKSESEFLMNLKSLNQSVVTWIEQHVEKNPFCILTPIFKDYEKHLEELEKEKKKDAKPTSDSTKGEEPAKEKKLETAGTITGGFKLPSNGFGQLGSTASSFGGSAPGNGGFSGFNFTKSSSASVGSFAFGSTSVPKTNTDAGGDEEYVPPTAEVSEVKEPDSFYSKRCKLFYQKDEKWVERGVGNLHLKKASDKLQLIIRADTNLGSIMLNIIMSESMTVKKQGKNNVFFVCIPNPPFDVKAASDKPYPILLRVKTSEDAEELISKIEENTK
ncbi:nuclear pore complex protein Nup50-like isoform X1 [Haliotis rufescens]|uniref:nuclear pore complex protein Nup50-like isoform X1 n=1 Tax=Haliotis rufescens TaxID=6454 RepID=UPI00201E7B35|nr:nuclear pore complex protein Nup50-like isoform X1 [Haliotis rufescens]XP_048242284.1 nuclear pore complex protein Nup50-like isoform X1 [Haliotis rufescens]